jgi:hypothetical protein
MILDELKQHDLKQIIDIKNISFECDYTLHNKYYLYVQFDDNIIVSLCIPEKICDKEVYGHLQNNEIHLYEIGHNFENSTTQIKRFCLQTICRFDNSIIHEITIYGMRSVPSHYKHTISNLNELNLFRDTINKHDCPIIIQVLFE